MNERDKAWSQQHLANYPTFEDFVRGWVTEENVRNQLHFAPQVNFVSLDGKLNVDFIGRVETINRDFKTVCDRLGIAADLAHLNESKRQDYKNYYSAETIEIVRQVYEEDIRTFEYSF